MKKLDDELLNKYIDGELDAETVEGLKKLISEDPEQLRILKAHKLVDETLARLEVHRAPVNFTDRMMKIIYENIETVKPKVNSFFIGIVAVFLAAIMGTLLYSLSIVSGSPASPRFSEYMNRGESILKNFTTGFTTFIGSDSMTMLGGALTVILLVSGYFLFDSHKKFKNKLTGI